MNDNYYKTYIPSSILKENEFSKKIYTPTEFLPYSTIKHLLPHPIWEGKDSLIEIYDKTWELAFANLNHPVAGSGFVSDFIDTAFNGCLFMWDSAFIMMFTKYAYHVFDFQQTLDNFYAKQHPDGFICREIHEDTGFDQFHRFDPASTGPNILPWAEWVYYENFGDKKRLKKIFPNLVAYHLWLKRYRTWQNGTYWSCGLGCGMDNQPRLTTDIPEQEFFSNDFMSWMDTTMQQFFSAQILIKMAKELNQENEATELVQEAKTLYEIINTNMWDERTSFYYDIRKTGEKSQVKTIGAFWALVSGLVPPARSDAFISHLSNESEFNRPHSIPTLSADDPNYEKNGQYWRGGVWAPTNYMVLCGLNTYNYFALAHKIALNHFNHVLEVFRKTGTLWENYSPESMIPGEIAKSDFVGWTGLSSISILFEYVFGITADVLKNTIIWNVTLLEKHGIENYPFGKNGLIHLTCLARNQQEDNPVIIVESNVSFHLVIKWEAHEKVITVTKTF